MLTPQQKQRILTALGYTVTGGRSFENKERICFCVYKNGRKIEREYRSELVAWDTWKPDGNFIETELKPFVRGLPKASFYRFSEKLYDAEGISTAFMEDGMTASIWLVFTPELLCTAFNAYLEEREGK